MPAWLQGHQVQAFRSTQPDTSSAYMLSALAQPHTRPAALSGAGLGRSEQVAMPPVPLVQGLDRQAFTSAGGHGRCAEAAAAAAASAWVLVVLHVI